MLERSTKQAKLWAERGFSTMRFVKNKISETIRKLEQLEEKGAEIDGLSDYESDGVEFADGTTDMYFEVDVEHSLFYNHSHFHNSFLGFAYFCMKIHSVNFYRTKIHVA